MPTAQSPRRLRPEKREAILAAGRSVFAQMGYGRAGTDAIAKAANVSTRTLYNHFPSKDELFRTVLLEAAEEVSAAFVERASTIDLDRDIDAVVLDVGQALAAHRRDFPQHFAMFQQVTSERDHFPKGLAEDWRRVGPARVEREVTRITSRLSASGALQTDDPSDAAWQLTLLTAGAFAFKGRLTDTEADEIVARGVRTFLHGHLRAE